MQGALGSQGARQGGVGGTACFEQRVGGKGSFVFNGTFAVKAALVDHLVSELAAVLQTKVCRVVMCFA